MWTGFNPSSCFLKSAKKGTLPLFIVTVADYPTWLESAPALTRTWLATRKFKPKPGACALLPSLDGVEGAVVTVGDAERLWDYASLSRTLPPGSYDAEPDLSAEVAKALCLGFALGSYQFNRYKKKERSLATLVWPEQADRPKVLALAEGICLCRDMINTPASDMGPAELESEALRLAKTHGAQLKVIEGDALLKKSYPMIHAVGRASSRAPRLLDMVWGKAKHPKITLVGKGVCFDTGGLDLKPPQYMKLMKKDMGGAALVLGLAHALMSQKLPVRLRVLVPAVENSVSGNAMRPLDVLSSRKGFSVEVGDTDAEGRLILADALFAADEEAPDLLIDAATLTGAARVALGTALPAIFGHSDVTWAALERSSRITHDPLWRMPLHVQYRSKLDSKVADLCNISSDGYAGAITAALFLREFITKERDWIHMDTMGYNLEARPGRPTGGEALGLLAFEHMLSERYGKSVLTVAGAQALRDGDAPPSETNVVPLKAREATANQARKSAKTASARSHAMVRRAKTSRKRSAKKPVR